MSTGLYNNNANGLIVLIRRCICWVNYEGKSQDE